MITGEIKVNDHTLLTWQAEHIGPVGLCGLHIYEVTATGIGNDHSRFEADFQLLHERDTGVVVMTAKVMEELYERFGPDRIPGQDSN